MQGRSATHLQFTHTYITTFVIFNMVPVYPGLGLSSLRVIHIPRALSLTDDTVTGDDVNARQTTFGFEYVVVDSSLPGI